ncbi:MAG: hypothetical protein WKF57_13075 [Nakamurella sp.]
MSDRSSADDAGHAPSALETELRAALHERGAAVTTATLLRPDPPGVQEFLPRRPVPRWRIVGAVAAVSVVILAVVLGRGVMAPQQVERTLAGATTTSVAESSFDASRVTGRLWGATSIVTAGNSFSVSTWEPTGSRTMTVEFTPDGTVVFHDGNRELRGPFTTDARGLAVAEISVRATSTDENDQFAQETAALDALLFRTPSPGHLTAVLAGDQLTLEHGATAVRYRSAGVTPEAARAAGAAKYPVVAAIGGTWRAAAVRIGGQNRVVSTATSVSFELASNGSFSANLLGAAATGRWWATGHGLVVTGFSETSGSLSPGASGGLYAHELEVLNGLMGVRSALSSGDVSVSFAAQGAQLIVTPTTGFGAPVTFVQG